MLSITPSKLSDYLVCPLKFKLRHLTGNRSRESSPALAFGISIHRALQEIHNTNSFANNKAEASKILSKHWDQSAFIDNDEAEYFEKGCKSLENYSRAVADSNEKTLGTEIFMSLIVDFQNLKVRLGCKVDRLTLHPNNQLEIVDYKTGRNGQVATPDFLIKDLPTFLYYVLTRLKFPQYPQIKISFINVLTMAKTTIEYDRKTVDENKRHLWECIKLFAVNEYQPKTSEACSWCSFQDDCPAMNEVIDYRKV